MTWGDPDFGGDSSQAPESRNHSPGASGWLSPGCADRLLARERRPTPKQYWPGCFASPRFKSAGKREARDICIFPTYGVN